MEKKNKAPVKYHHSLHFHCYNPKWTSWTKFMYCMLTCHKELALYLEKYYINWKPYSYHIISAEIFLSTFHDHSPFQCNWSVIQWWYVLRKLVHHTFLDECWETKVCCQNRACIQSVCSSLKKNNKKIQDWLKKGKGIIQF